MPKMKVTIVGAGNIGSALASILAGPEEFSIQVLDRSEEALDRLEDLNIAAELRTYTHDEELQKILSDQDVAVAAVPQSIVPQIATAAARSDTHYLDFVCATPETLSILAPLAEHRAVFTGCGVSPGIIGNVAYGLLEAFAPVTDLTIRVGAIPKVSTNRIGYGQIWNVDGLIDEYTQPSAAVRDGKAVMLSPLENYGHLSIDGVRYEEFVTSGGLADLSIFGDPGPKNVTFKTIRYPGHLDYMRFLLDDLGLRNRRDALRSLLYNGLPIVKDDVLLLVVTASGYQRQRPIERTVCHRFSPIPVSGRLNALTSVATGYAATLLAMLYRGEIPPVGFVPHHAINTETLLSSPFLKPLIHPGIAADQLAYLMRPCGFS
ncbi:MULTISPECIES: saccharopine dehydrogenase C-terminal domain-containing protein [unclassified Ensifer]|jgi:saccharopine dehydrogenase-like NADP-dependent oxidoreductase|uniref:saccharopine dehydrogenase family protein n=2 Tax=Sinorhizobium/Ensifer group TaxID=227292 RepID=UPI00042F0454|nr:MULTISPECIES: saccharopine dehydrogenase C-terminal domain-containing protein [unclassified Ensifer]AHK46485.1 dehydrogenase [Ensifer adhaerens OV14]KQW79509.1 pyridine nucleotide-disulfide oxidoreductase [Ensifer sp. Root127]KQY72542.1 pyridine nucleotide-disulfide oxidoreductase [Ensifer sp. Root142]MDP9632753.1 saccharopine dehydrogenase-like NADP-dependent oxidoreductase [Ensifer adhaerens]NOV17727.1 pyridine nucleotide-disulfide oxidoreductase [Ensifer canadensis]